MKQSQRVDISIIGGLYFKHMKIPGWLYNDIQYHVLTKKKKKSVHSQFQQKYMITYMITYFNFNYRHRHNYIEIRYC